MRERVRRTHDVPLETAMIQPSSTSSPFSFARALPARFLASTLLALVLAIFMGCSAGGSGKNKGETGLDGTSCSTGTISCGETCVAPLSDSRNCGGCGNVCPLGEQCEAGACASFCPTGTLECGGVCTVAGSDVYNCGTCGTVCPVGQYCDQGACSASCSGTLCTGLSGAAECAHPTTNNNHCGACGVTCGAGQACQGGVCATACPDGRLACGTGCADVRTDPQNCGACGVTCELGVSCENGVCGGNPTCIGDACSCPLSQTECSGSCVDLGTSPLHCGGCGVACKASQNCSAGTCQCPLSTRLCGETCANTSTDSQNCGGCGITCSAGTTCQSGACVCPVGQMLCAETCTSTQTDPNHCGSCGSVCESYEQCVAGTCTYEGDQCGGAAGNVNISRVSLYQAVELDLFANGVAVNAAARKVDVVVNREALVRVFVAPAQGFSPRELSARLFVKNTDGVQVFHHKRQVSTASTASSLSSTFLIDVPASAIQSSTEYWVELVECTSASAGSVGTVRFPQIEGTTALLQARRTGVVKVTFVPITHGGRTPDTSNATMQAFAGDVEKMYPTEDVEWSVSAPMSSGQFSSLNWESLLNSVTSKRAADSPPDDVYYYGIVDPAASYQQYCSGGCILGLGWIPELGGWGAVNHRAAIGIGFGAIGASTFSHELGHNHGRQHSPCGGAAGADPGYPHAGALTGVWGYDREQKALRDPGTHKDFMSYCQPAWISDHNFRSLANRIAAINGFSILQPFDTTAPVTTWQRALVTSSGATWLAPAQGPGAPGKNPEGGAVYDDQGNQVAEVDIYRVEMSHDSGYMLYLPSKEPGWFAIGPVGGPILVY